MAFQRVPNTYEIRLNWTYAPGIQGVNIFHVRYGAHNTLTSGVADVFAENFEGALDSSGIAAFLHTGVTLDTIVVTDLDSATGPQFEGAFDAFAGTDANEYIPLQANGMLEFTTALRGRSFRGRTFLAGFTEAASAGGAPTAGCITAIGQFGAALIAANHTIGPPTIDLAVVSRFSGTHLVAGPGGQTLRRPLARAEAIATPINAALAETVWKTQRRRAVAG